MTEEKVRLGIDPIYSLKGINPVQQFIFGLQQAVAMFGATVLVPLLTGLDVNTTLLMAGLGTLLFHVITGFKVPVFLGSSFAFIVGYNIVAGSPFSDSFDATKLPYASGGIFVAGLIYCVLALIIKVVGVKRVMRWFPPVVTGPIIIGIGLILAPVALNDIQRPIEGVPVAYNWLVALTAIIAIIVINIWGKGMLRVIPILIGVIAAYIVAVIVGMVDFSALKATEGIVAIPIYKENIMKFDVSAIITIAPIALATMMEHVGDVSAVSATVGRNFMADPGLHRTLIGDGLATSMAAVFGGPANTTYSENTGVLALTRIFAPGVMRIAACIAIVASLFPHVGSFIRSIPGPAIGGVSCILYGMISAIGVRNLIENQVDLTKARNLMIVTIILVSGLGISMGSAGGINFTIGDAKISLSGLAVAAILGILLNAILPGKDYDFKEDEAKED
ncbi:MAG TPA: uracil-xanthine permease [Clostridiaceae bacterium]|nr:uracil-xanthine permease [Clostridiaceae bacterium]